MAPMRQKKALEIKDTPRSIAAGLTQVRLKRIQDFKAISRTDVTRYGQLGSPKWGDELHKFFSDKRVTREDIQRWMDTKREVTEALPKTGRKHKSRRDTVVANLRSQSASPPFRQTENPRSRSSSANSASSEMTIATPATYNLNKTLRNSEGPSVLNRPRSGRGQSLDFCDGSQNRAHVSVKHSSPPNAGSHSRGFPKLPRQGDFSQTSVFEDATAAFTSVLHIFELSRKYSRESLAAPVRQIYTELSDMQKNYIIKPQQIPFIKLEDNEEDLSSPYADVDPSSIEVVELEDSSSPPAISNNDLDHSGSNGELA